MKDFLMFLFAIIIAITLVIGGVVGLISTISSYQCKKYGEATGNETKYIGLDCYGKIDGKWYASDEYNKIYVAERKNLEVEVKP